MQLNLWWRIEYRDLNFGITIDRGYVLNKKKSLRYFQDIHEPGRNDFLGWDEARLKFSLVEVYARSTSRSSC